MELKKIRLIFIVTFCVMILGFMFLYIDPGSGIYYYREGSSIIGRIGISLFLAGLIAMFFVGGYGYAYFVLEKEKEV